MRESVSLRTCIHSDKFENALINAVVDLYHVIFHIKFSKIFQC